MYCPKCRTTYSIKKTVINFQNLPVDEDVEAKYCPVCGTHEPTDGIVSITTNLYDGVERYSHCIVEVLTNSITGETSVGWYKTDETEELEEI